MIKKKKILVLKSCAKFLNKVRGAKEWKRGGERLSTEVEKIKPNT